MSSRAITGGERLPRSDEGSGIGSEVLEEVGKTIKHDKTFNRSWCGSEPMISKTYQRLVLVNSIIKTIHKYTQSGKQNCEYAEAHKLDRLSPPRVNE